MPELLHLPPQGGQLLGVLIGNVLLAGDGIGLDLHLLGPVLGFDILQLRSQIGLPLPGHLQLLPDEFELALEVLNLLLGGCGSCGGMIVAGAAVLGAAVSTICS